jgi:DNA-binding NarL/FixJ family response regulator
MPRIRILVADDHALVREGITAILRLHEDLEVAGRRRREGGGQKALKLPDILMDIAMPGLGAWRRPSRPEGSQTSKYLC